uniref:AB hydrolase-1 domain-containing protein n=1 Tax=Attheya septentrionalis TaxID=420275 RepID=A0A7S2UKP1_9STRA|mmetsp:Transcript_26615/g.48307  ORF Transcript_26615/g.48307 Transcript_26615/m.48307 type:complete len:401 (+) Transcript_26615:316-1518(+)
MTHPVKLRMYAQHARSLVIFGVAAVSLCSSQFSHSALAFQPALVLPVRTGILIHREASKRVQFSSRTPLLSSPTGTTVDTDVERNMPTKTPLVQRKYKTYLWKKHLHSYNINYRMEGPLDGPPVLLVHGFGANVNHFRYQFPALVEAGYRVYAIDLLGFGASDKPKEEEYCIELWVDLLVDFLKAMDMDMGSDERKSNKWVVGGNSIGGLCSLSVTEKLPDLVRGCVLFNCSGGMTGFRYTELPIFIRPILYFVQKVVLGQHLGGRFFQNFKSRENVESILVQQGVYGDTTNVNDELLEILLGPSEDDGAQEVFLKVFAGPPGPTPESILPNINVPILALWGDSDPWTPLEGGLHPGSTFGNYTDDFKLVSLPGAGHCPHDEAPGLVNKEMISWLKELDV